MNESRVRIITLAASIYILVGVVFRPQVPTPEEQKQKKKWIYQVLTQKDPKSRSTSLSKRHLEGIIPIDSMQDTMPSPASELPPLAEEPSGEFEFYKDENLPDSGFAEDELIRPAEEAEGAAERETMHAERAYIDDDNDESEDETLRDEEDEQAREQARRATETEYMYTYVLNRPEDKEEATTTASSEPRAEPTEDESATDRSAWLEEDLQPVDRKPNYSQGGYIYKELAVEDGKKLDEDELRSDKNRERSDKNREYSDTNREHLSVNEEPAESLMSRSNGSLSPDTEEPFASIETVPAVQQEEACHAEYKKEESFEQESSEPPSTDFEQDSGKPSAQTTEAPPADSEAETEVQDEEARADEEKNFKQDTSEPPSTDFEQDSERPSAPSTKEPPADSEAETEIQDEEARAEDYKAESFDQETSEPPSTDFEQDSEQPSAPSTKEPRADSEIETEVQDEEARAEDYKEESFDQESSEPPSTDFEQDCEQPSAPSTKEPPADSEAETEVQDEEARAEDYKEESFEQDSSEPTSTDLDQDSLQPSKHTGPRVRFQNPEVQEAAPVLEEGSFEQDSAEPPSKDSEQVLKEPSARTETKTLTQDGESPVEEESFEQDSSEPPSTDFERDSEDPSIRTETEKPLAQDDGYGDSFDQESEALSMDLEPDTKQGSTPNETGTESERDYAEESFDQDSEREDRE
jgi:hypothetical protein